MIPLLGIPVLNRGDLLLRCLKSIDFPIGEIVIINNGRDPSVANAIRKFLLDLRLRVHENYTIVWDRPDNLGVAGSWNALLKRANEIGSHYVVIAGNDMQFAPGDLQRVHEFAILHPDHELCFGHAHNFFAIRTGSVNSIGYFDENFYPAYLEDCDHFYRIKLTGAKTANVPGCTSIHGEAPSWGSSTIHSDPEYRAACHRTHGRNFEYYRAKWGGNNGHEIFTHPFNDPQLPVSYWKLDEERRKKQLWP